MGGVPKNGTKGGAAAVRWARFLRPFWWCLALGWLCACDLRYPEVAVVHRLDPGVLIRNPSFNGCRWAVTLAYGESTGPRRCLPGTDRVHFQKLDLAADEQATGEGEEGEATQPLWFHYQTIRQWTVDAGDFRLLEVLPGDVEQDFSIPGPYGH